MVSQVVKLALVDKINNLDEMTETDRGHDGIESDRMVFLSPIKTEAPETPKEYIKYFEHNFIINRIYIFIYCKGYSIKN